MDNGQEGTLQQAKYASAVRPAPLSAEPIIPPGCHRALGSGRNEKKCRVGSALRPALASHESNGWLDGGVWLWSSEEDLIVGTLGQTQPMAHLIRLIKAGANQIKLLPWRCSRAGAKGRSRAPSASCTFIRNTYRRAAFSRHFCRPPLCISVKLDRI